MCVLLEDTTLSQATQVIDAAGDGGKDFVRGIIQHWSYMAERHLTDVYQIPGTVSPLHRRYEGSFARTRHEPPDEEQVVLDSLSKVVTPAWCQGSGNPKACPDAQAWRNLSKRASLLSASQGMARLQLLVSLRRWQPPMLIAQSDPTVAPAYKLK